MNSRHVRLIQTDLEHRRKIAYDIALETIEERRSISFDDLYKVCRCTVADLNHVVQRLERERKIVRTMRPPMIERINKL